VVRSSGSAEAALLPRAAGWRPIHLALIASAHAVMNGRSDLVGIARFAVKVAEGAGYRSLPNERATRLMGAAITRWQTHLYAMNEHRDWRFPDSVLLVGWLIECGGPKMGRGPARADFEANGVELMVGGTRWRYNNHRYGHGGAGLPASREYQSADCIHMGRRR
jgi:hypothetical protein